MLNVGLMRFPYAYSGMYSPGPGPSYSPVLPLNLACVVTMMFLRFLLLLAWTVDRRLYDPGPTSVSSLTSGMRSFGPLENGTTLGAFHDMAGL